VSVAALRGDALLGRLPKYGEAVRGKDLGESFDVMHLGAGHEIPLVARHSRTGSAAPLRRC
jgi:hypothetical protein